MAQYQDKAKARIKKGLTKINRIVDKGREEDFNEADTRKIVTQVMTELLGWDQFEHLTAEQMIGSRYADFVVRSDDEEVAVIEVKAIGLKLKETHLNQARLYAIDEGIEWICLTNGDAWNVYHLDYSGKVPETTQVFSIAFSDGNTKPAEKTALLYLLSRESYKKHEIRDYYNRKIALSADNLACQLLEDDVLNKIRLNIKHSSGQTISNEDVANALVRKLYPQEVVSDEIEKRLRAIHRA